MDVSSFTVVLEDEGVVVKDKNRVYCGYKEFKGVDVPSFTVVREDEGVVVKDKNRTYEIDCE